MPQFANLGHTAQAVKTRQPKNRPSETQRTVRQLHAVDVGLECLQHPPRAVTGEHLVRLLRQVQVCMRTSQYRYIYQGILWVGSSVLPNPAKEPEQGHVWR